jgi:hypothetical protein
VTLNASHRSVKCRSRSVHDAATLQVLDLCGVARRLCIERPGGYPVFPLQDAGSMVVPDRTPRPPTVERSAPTRFAKGDRMRPVAGQARSIDALAFGAAHRPRGGSRDVLLKRMPATLARDQNASIRQRPRDAGTDRRLPGEFSVAVPHWALERVSKLVSPAPYLDVNQLADPAAAECDRPDAASDARATGERHERDISVTTLKLLPDILAPQELASTAPQPRDMRARHLPPRRRTAQLARQGAASRAWARSPPAGYVQARSSGPIFERGESLSAATTRRRPAFGTPLGQPGASIAHRDALPTERTAACRTGLPSTHGDPDAPLMHPLTEIEGFSPSGASLQTIDTCRNF